MSTRRGDGFNPRVVLALLLFGGLTFLALLYLIGSGQTGGDTNNGRGHAASKGLTGYAGLAQLLEKDGHEVRLSRSRSGMNEEALLILTPPHSADAEDIASVIRKRRWDGPTLLIMPKWLALPLNPSLATGQDIEDGWVTLLGTQRPAWAEELGEEGKENAPIHVSGESPGATNIELDVDTGSTGWSGLGLNGKLPQPSQVQSIKSGTVTPLVSGENNTILAAYVNDDGWYPTLHDAAGFSEAETDHLEGEWWNVTIIAEPDLMNNYGLADRQRAQLAVQLVEAAMEDQDYPVVFDLTLNGLGKSKNLLTLAFTPPFLAATLCLVVAMIVIAWRAFFRFGPALAEGRQIAFGKERLVRNSAGFVQRTGRLYLLSRPYADMMRNRIAAALGLTHADDQTIDTVLARRLPNEPSFSSQITTLEQARSQPDILRAADALSSIERKLSR